MRSFGIAAAVTVALAAIMLATVAGPVQAQEKLLRGIPSAQQWSDELAPDPESGGGVSRAISPTHGLDDQGGKRAAKPSGPAKASASSKGASAGKAAADPKPKSASAPILFEYDSADLTATAKQQLDELAGALKSDKLGQYTFRVEGHTDAVGSDDYNKTLSARRAEAVVQYLITAHGITPERLVAVGRGEAELLAPADPTSAENRRVRIVNLGAL